MFQVFVYLTSAAPGVLEDQGGGSLHLSNYLQVMYTCRRTALEGCVLPFRWKPLEQQSHPELSVTLFLGVSLGIDVSASGVGTLNPRGLAA